MQARMTYFRYGFLNTLRDELWLTVTRQRVTLFLLLYLVIPGAGLGAGIGWGKQAHDPLKISHRKRDRACDRGRRSLAASKVALEYASPLCAQGLVPGA